MNQHMAQYFQNLNKAHTIEIQLQPKCPNSPLFVVDELELAIFKKYIILAFREIEFEREKSEH